MTKIRARALSNETNSAKTFDCNEEIVISGIAGRFPDSDNVKYFQENLFNKVDLVSDDDRRWKFDHPEIPRRAGKVNNINKFDASFFDINYKKAHTMDPMGRMLLEHTYEAIVDAGINPRHLRGSKTGVFIGLCFSESDKTWFYEKLQVDEYGFDGCDRAMIANRVSEWLGVTGPSYVVDTACSSSLYAMEHALRAIRNGLCDSAVVGATNLCLHPFVTMQFYRLGVLSPDGRSKVFDNSADGYVRAEAISVVYLQKAKDAKRIYGTFVHAKTNCDGFKEMGITFPSSDVQTILLQEFYEECGVNPNDIDFVEAHGTGTKAGDPAEINTLEEIFCKNRSVPLLVGSVKSNMGHSEPASGLCSVTKAVIAMESRCIPPNLHYRQVRQGIKALEEGRIKVVLDVTPWKGRYVAINSFGFGGANCHVLLKSNPKEKVNNGFPKDDLPRLIAVSGRTEFAVDSLLSDVESRLVDVEHVKLLHDIHSEDIYGHFYRGYTIIGGNNTKKSPLREIKRYSSTKKQIWFILSGLGSQWPAMGEALLKFPVFSYAIHKCNVLEPHGVNIFDILSNKDNNYTNDIVKSLVGITAVQIGLVDLLAHVNITPDYIIGYSVGEFACAYADGCFTAEQAILSAYYCAAATIESNLAQGILATVGLDQANLKKLCPPDIQVISNDAIDNATIGGPTESMNKFMKKLQLNKIVVKQVPSCNIPYHSTGVASIGKKLVEYLKKVISQPKPRSCKWLSTSLPRNEWTTPAARVASAEYITNCMLKPILFQEACSEIPKNAVLIEIAPHGVLQTTLHKLTKHNTINIVLMQSYHKNNAEVVLQALGKLYNIGFQPQIQNLYPEVQYPVSRGTPMISPVIKWDHTEDWYVTKFSEDEKIASRERYVEVTLSHESYEYMSGHMIDRRNLFPATGYLFLIWQTLGLICGISLIELPVMFKNVKFQRATTIPKNGSVLLTLMIQKCSGKFEVIEGGAAVVTGSIHKVTEAPVEKINFPSTNDKQIDKEGEKVMLPRDVYKELRLRGYHYTGLFRGISSASFDGSKGRIAWENNWVAFMDNMLQLKILGTDTRGLFVPTGIDKLIIHPKAHLNQVNSTITNERFFTAYVHEKYKTVVAGGIEIQGLKANAISRRKPAGDPVLEEYKFVAHHDRTEIPLKEAIRLATHIALENHLGIKVRTVEMVDKNEDIDIEELVSPLILEILCDMPLLQPDISVAVDSKIYEKDTIPHNIIVTDLSELSIEPNSLITVGYYLFSKHKDNVITTLLSILKEEGFLLVFESIDFKFTDSKWFKEFHIILEKKVNSGFLLFLRKVHKIEKHDSVIRVNNKEFSWVEEMKKSLNSVIAKKSNSNNRIILVGEHDFECGLIGLVNCLMREPGGEMVRGVLIQDPKAPEFSLENPFYAEQLRKDLVINVLRPEYTWGSYRHLPLPPLKSVPVHHAMINQTVRGDLSSLQWFQAWIPSDFKHEDLIHVMYSSLNFRDVMLATGKLSADVVITSRLQDCVIGFEYSGIDSSGKRVMGIVGSSALTNLLVVDKSFCWNVPDCWTLEAAATVPCVYATCLYALYITGKMKKDDKILIHAGSGGVGQAAIHLALFEGCEIFTTVGTPEKREFIKKTFPQIPEDHIGNSRDTSFEQMILTQTKGKGVDIVLNSLSEEKLLASVRCLSQGGRFLEIGKFDLVANNSIGLNNFSREISFHGIMLDNLIKNSDEKKTILKNCFNTYLENGAIKPLTRTVFSKEKVEAAFRYMAAGKHIGKVLINVHDENEPFAPILALPRYHARCDCSYLILGGLGGFGLELADWLVLRGARNLVFTSRKGIKNGYQQMRINLWKSYGVRVLIISEKDASKREDCEFILKNAEKLGAIDGIFNLAVVLRDSLWENQGVDTFEESFRSKAWSTNNLDKLTRKMCPHLRHFVVFSSVSCGRGNAGQTNYGMSNSVMERICEKRAEEGLPALAIQWGAVGDVGLVADMQENNKELIIGGTLQQSISSCLKELESFLLQNSPIVASMVVAEKKAGSGGSTTIVDAILNILGLKDLKSVSQQTALSELGMDSMMAVEIKQTLEREFEILLTAQDIRGLNFSKLIQLSKQQNNMDKKSVAQLSNESEALIGIKLLVRTLGADNINLEPFIKLPSREEKDRTEVFLIPGLEGYGSIFIPLADKIKAPAICLQLSLNDNKNISIADMAREILPHVLSRSKGRKNFVLVGYSFGSLVTIELARILEEKGFNGRLVLIDGSPDLVKAIVDQQLSSQSDEELENSVLLGIMNIIAPMLSSQLINQLGNQKSWEQKVECMFALAPEENIKLSLDLKKAICTSIYYRLRSVKSYSRSTLPPINSSITLIKPTQPTLRCMPENYGLQNVTKGNIEVYYGKGNHVTLLESEHIAAAINGEKIQKSDLNH